MTHDTASEDRVPTRIELTESSTRIENGTFAVTFDLATGNYSGIDKATGLAMFKNAWYRIGEGGWQEQPLTCEAEDRGATSDCFGSARTLRVWYRQESRYEPHRLPEWAEMALQLAEEYG